MTEKYFKYSVDGRDYDVPESRVQEFEKVYPSSTIKVSVDDRKYDVPPSRMEEFLKVYPDASYSFDKEGEKKPKKDSLNNTLTSVNDSLMRAQHGANMTFADSNMDTVTSTPQGDRTSWGESLAKGTGAGFTRTGKGLLDALTILSSNNTYVDPMSANPIHMLRTGKGPELIKTPDYDTLMQEKEDPMIKASLKMGEVADRLSKEADPTHGEKSFVDLISEGKIGMALQKGLATGAESLPMTLSAYNPYTMALNMVSMAGSNYAEQTLENPEVDKWKRATQAIGSAALEQAVEKFADPIFKYIGGGAAGEFTETMAREILEDGINEATEGISKRIFNVIKNAGKDALGEGGEEIITSFGNDLLGEALDLIDGDKDYGIRAQWEQMKEENPNANLGDFAKSKAKEYMDSFIGGALSGAYMSGTTQTLSEASQYASDRKSINAMNAARELGASMNYGDLYDVDSDVNDAKAAITDSFVNETGGAILSPEFIDSLSSEDAFALSRSEDVSAGQRGALAKYAIEKAKQESLNKKLDENLENNIATARARIEGVTENGQVVSGMHNGKVVYVTGGVVKNGAVTLPNGENGPVLVVDSTTGDKMTVRSEEISSASTIDSQKLIGDVETFFRNSEAQNRDAARNTMSVRAKHRAIQPYAGKKILVDLGNGTTEVFVQKISNNGDVVIKGKKGDLGGQSILTLSSDVFYDSIYRDGDGNPVVTEAGPQEAEQEAPQAETPQEQAPDTEIPQTPVEPADFRDFADTIILNGKPIRVDEVTAQDDVSDSITYRYTDENGVQRTGNMTIGAFAEAVNLGRQQAETPAPAPEPAPAPTAEGETIVPPTEQATETPAPTPAPAEQTEQAPVDWETMLDFEPENYLAEMQNRYGDKTVRMLNAVLSATQRQLDKLNKATPDAYEEILQNEVKKDILQARIDKLSEMVARLTAPSTPEAPAEAAPEDETPEAPAGETPAPATEVPSEPAPVPAEPEPAPETPSTPDGEAPAAPVGEAPATPEVPTTPEPAPAPAPQPAQAPVYNSSSDKAGNGFERIVKSFKAQIDKLIKKTSVKDFVGTDNTRPVMTGVYRENGYEYASDSMILVKVKAQYPAEQEGKIISAKTGKEIEGKYPKADVVIESSIDGTSKLSDNIDDIIAYAQTLEEIKKGMVKDAKLYVRVGNSIFESSRLLTAAKMAKKHGLTNILQKGEANRAMVFEGVNGVVLVMPINNTMVSENIIDIASGRAEFGYNALNYLKTPATLKGIEAAKTTLEAVLPRLGLIIKDEAKESGELQYVNGNVVWRFDKNDIAKAKEKANDPNTYAALEEIEKNGLIIPMSLNDAETIFPELFVSEPISIGDTTPTAPNPVANPVDEAKKKERQLITNLAKIGLAPEAKQDLAYNAGKAVADMFPTREAYDAYAETAADFGAYNTDFERGVEDSFAARNKQNTSNPPVNSVPLENEPNGENNGEQQPTSNEPSTEGRGSDTTGGGTNDGGNQEGSEGTQKTKSSRTSKGKTSQTEQVEDKYPARKGNATQKLLVDTFGFESVTIPNTRKEILNTIYDFMMEMSKTLGISPKSIGQGGWLNVRNKPTNRKAIASHEMLSNKLTREITDVSLRFKYSRLSSIAHEWWHSLDRALGYFNTGKLETPTTEVGEESFTGRKEAWEAVKGVMDAISKSGYTTRIANLVKGQTRSVREYFLSNTEQVARAFDEYITMRFAEAGITIDNYDNHRDDTQPTAEEMKVISPAIDNLFKVLKEKEGKKTGTSVLYHIGEMMEENTEVKKELGEQVAEWIKQGGNFVVMDSAEMQKAIVENGLHQLAKRRNRSIYNSSLTSDEKKKIREYILSLPLDVAVNRPYMVKFGGYAYIFNASRRFFEENTTKKPKGDGFEILHKRELASLSVLETKLLDATYGEDSGDISEVLQILGIDKGRSSDSSSVTADAGTEGNYDRVDEAEYRESSTADGGNNSSLRDTGNIQKLETPDGIIYGFVKEGVVYLDPTLINPNTAIHEYTHLWDNALMQLNRPLWEKGKALMKQTPIWDEVINDPNYADIKDNEDLVASEVHSRLVGTNGAERLNQLEQEARGKGLTKSAKELSILGRLREWLNEATKWLKDAFTTWSKEELDAVTLTDFLNMPLRDLANFTKLPASEVQATQFSIIPDGDLKAKLQKEIDNGEYITLYRAVRKINGKYYSPKMSKLGGVGQEIVLGQLEQSDERPDLAYPVQMKDGSTKYKVNLDGSDPAGTGLKSRTTAGVDYNPYIHASDSMMNDQFTAAFAMPEMTVIEVRVPKSELTSGYHAQYAADHVGLTPWKSGTVDLKLPKDEQRNVYLSRYDMPVREVPTEEIADHIAAKLLRNGLSMPYNLVTPQVAEALIRRGVDVSEKPSGTVPAGQNEKFKELKESVLNEMKDNDISDLFFRSSIDSEMEAIKDEAIANGTFMKAPNGQPTKLNERQWLQVRTQNFLDWFGDWMNDPESASKIIDENGEPMVMHHGSDWKPLEEPKGEAVFRMNDGLLGKGAYFSNNVAEATSYAEIATDLDMTEGDNYELLQDEYVTDYFLNVRNEEDIYRYGDDMVAVAKSPSQIKSATDNTGTFDPLQPDIRYRNEENSLTSQSYENTEDAYATNDGRGTQPETEGVQGEVSVSGPLGEERRLYNPEGREISQSDFSRFNPIHEREGESDNRRNLRETRFFETFEKLTIDEKLMLYNFLRESFHKSSGILRSMTRNFINTVRQNGNNSFADFVENFVNDELKYREGISAKIAARHGVLIGVSYDASRLEQIFDAYNEDRYNETLFDRAIRLAKRFGVSIKFATRNEDGSFFSAFGNYNPSDNTITLDANLLVDGNTAELCQTIVHELIHSVVARAASIMSGRAVDNNKQFIDPLSLPKDVIDGINALKEVYDAIKDDGTFQDTYGKKDFEEMLSEITDSKFRGLLKAKNLWKKFLNGVCKILGIKDTSATESDALTEVESALDKIFQSAERGELDNLYAGYLGQLAEGYTLEDLQNLGSGPVKSLLTQNKLFKTGIDPTEVATQTASLVYDKVVSDNWQEFQRQFQDAMQPVRIAIDAIQQETGNIPIEDYENYILIQNQSSSRSRVEIDDFARRYYSPIIEQVNKIIDTILESRGYDKNDRVKRSEVYNELKTYLIAKHGLERNAYYQTRNTRKITAKTKAERIKSVREDHKDIVDQIKNDPTLSPSEKANLIRQEKKRRDTLINQIRDTDYELDVRDYSGLTALFGFRPEQFEEAEEEAKKCVEDFENAIATDELWAKIKSATDKTLRHSYESGLLSRQQYNDIKNMFEFYIPLRGFDESTAEDVYAYARFEGNRFNPAVQKAEGRTSLADDPIAIIMNMAESEIAQGNKNRAKQALYNYLLNRSDGMENQNSLMQIESVWAIKTIDAFGNELYVIASPDHAAGETLAEFEERMQAMAEVGLAKKSQKGQVDVGMRFQKQYNKDAHYVYLKVNGVEKAIYINGNPKAADAINGTYAPMPSEFMQKVKDVQRLVSSTFTNYSLEFTARNYFRDMVYSHINIGVRESDPAYRKKFRQNWRHNNMRAMLKMLTAYRAGEYDGRPLTEDEAAFVEFMNNGGQTGYTLINSVETHKKELERAIERMQKGIVKGGVKDTTIFRYTLGGIELLNEASELVTRFAAFKTSRDMGRGINRSINDAKEVTVNFNTKGAQDGSGWMGVVARYLGAVKYFFNASVQGVQNLYKAFQTNKLKFGTVVGSTIGLGMLMPVLQGALSELIGGDEDEYWNIPEYDRQNNICIVIGKGKYVKLPLPIGFQQMYGLGDLIMAGILDKKFSRSPLSVGMDVANKIATIVLPINPLEGSANGLSLIESGQDMLLPDFTQGMVQNRTNTDFKGVPIQKEYTYNENDPQWTKAFANNPSWLKGLSKWCYENIEINGEGWDWSPEKLDNTLSNAFGGIYSLLKKTGRTVSAIWNEDNRTLSNVPLVGVIVGSNIDDDQRFVNSTYWEMDEYYNKRLYKIKSTAKDFGLTLDDVFARNPEGERAGEHHPAMNKIYNKDYFDFMQEWYLGHKGEGETDENGNEILGLSQIKNKIKNLENKIKKNEDGKATPEQDEELVELNNLYEATRRDLVNDLLELD